MKKHIKIVLACLFIIVFSVCLFFFKAESPTDIQPVSIEKESVIDTSLQYEEKQETKIEQKEKTGDESEIFVSESPETPVATIEEETTVCSLIIKCDELLKNIEKLDINKRPFVPENGIILQNNNISFSEGESVFDVLSRELRKLNIPFEYTKSTSYNNVYIEGINNLYEHDLGGFSGWLYMVNGKSPNYGCSQYILKNKDTIEFTYYCNLQKTHLS